MARIKVVIAGNEFEAEGDEAFLKSLYEDFKLALASAGQQPLKQVDSKQLKDQVENRPPKAKSPGAKPQSGGRKKTNKSVSADRNLNLRPTGQRSFADFTTEKVPTNNHEKNLLSVYYLTEVLDQASVTAAQIVSCYDDRGWRVPSDIKNSLQVTASTQGWINTEKSEEIILEVKGRNHVKFDMKAKEEQV